MERAVIWSEKVGCSSKMKPRCRAEWEVSSEELCVLASWFLSLMSTNSVLEELRVRRISDCENLTIKNGEVIACISICRYLGVYFVSGRELKCFFDQAKQKFFRSFSLHLFTAVK